MFDNNNNNEHNRYLGVMQTYDDCFSAAVNTVASEGGPFYSFTWHNINISATSYAGHCYGIRDFSWQPVIEANIQSGRLIGANIYSNVVSNVNSFQDSKFYSLRVNNQRGIRARYPDQIPETGMQYSPLSGWITYSTKWVAPESYATAVSVIQTNTDWPGVEWPPVGPYNNTAYTGMGDWGEFFVGKGGACNTTNKLGMFFIVYLFFFLFSLLAWPFCWQLYVFFAFFSFFNVFFLCFFFGLFVGRRC